MSVLERIAGYKWFEPSPTNSCTYISILFGFAFLWSQNNQESDRFSVA